MRATNRGKAWLERGATMVEYALAVTLLITVSIGAIKALEVGAKDEVNNQASCVSDRPPPVSCVRRAVTTTTRPSGPTTTAPPAPPTTTVNATWGTTTVFGSGSTTWGFDQIVSVRQSTPSAGIPNVLVRARVQLAPATGQPTQPPFFISCTTGAAGTCTLHFDVPINPTPGLTISVQSVTPADGSFVAGAPPSTLAVNAPP